MRRFRFDARGTRFRIYPQPRGVPGFGTPRIVHVNSRPGTIGPGPADSRMYVVDALGKRPYRWKLPYSDEATGDQVWRPPYPRRAPRNKKVTPRSGHFSHLTPGTRAFSAAHVFATVRCVLQIWEHYVGRRIPWFFKDRDYPRLEIIPRAGTNNSWSSEGYLEFGFLPGTRGDTRVNWLSENFDLIAHETGHLILKSVIGNPTNAKKTLEYRAHEEAAADLVALVACLHFDEVVRRLLKNTKGRLFSRNMLSRFAERGRTLEVRQAFNAATMSSRSVTRAKAAYDKHDYSKPFTGGAFDVFVEIYERHLVKRRAVPVSLARRSRSAIATALASRSPRATHRRFLQLREEFTRHFEEGEEKFREALLDARDDFARLLVKTWDRTSVKDFSYRRAVANMLAADARLNRGRYAAIIRRAFRQRGILPAQARA